MQPLTRQSSFLQIFLPGLLLGSTLVFTRFSLGQFAPQMLVAMRLLVATAVFLTAYAVFRVREWPRDRTLWLRGAVYGLIGTAITMTGYTNSLRYQSSGVTSLLATLSPIITALLAHVFLKDDPLTRRRIFGALIAFLGAGLLLLRGESGLSQLAAADWRGYAWAMLGVVTNSAGLVYARRFLGNTDPFVVTSIRILTGAVTVGLLVALTSGFDFSHVRWSGVGALMYAAVAGTFFAFVLYLNAVQRFGATLASQTEYVVPLAATGLGVVMLGEQVTLAMAIGMTIIFIGLAIFNETARQNRNS